MCSFTHAFCDMSYRTRHASLLGDLISLTGRFSAVFTQRTGAVPVSRSYVVSRFMEKDPSTRPQILAGADEDVEAFADERGLVIDTRDLFELLRRVDDASLTTAAARVLRGSTGRLPLGE
jgi:hypothetical protein